MKDSMRYITVEENELYEKLAEIHGIKGYTTPQSLSCRIADSNFEEQFSSWKKKQEEKK